MTRRVTIGRDRWCAGLGLLVGLVLVAGPLASQTRDARADPAAQTDGYETLNLLVILNGRDTGVVAEFRLTVATGALSATRSDLADAGIAPPQDLGRQIDLNAIVGLQSVYDEAGQTIALSVPISMLVAQQISAQDQRPPEAAQPGWGLVLNYQISGNLGDDILHDGFQATSLYAGLDLRAYTPLGVFETTGAASTQQSGGAVDWRRLDSSFVRVAQDQLLTVTLGDFVSAGADWTRPVRMGGVQIRRDFSLNPSFVTDPLLSYSGVAVLPSGVDVFVNNVRAWSGKVDAGPFILNDVPLVTAQGEAVIVLRDPSGQEHVNRVPFFETRNLLHKGVADYALQAGYPRENYGEDNFAYGTDAIGAASLRYGVTDGLTLNCHVEGTTGLVMFGAGFDTTVLHRAEFGLSAAESQSDAGRGQLVDLQLRTRFAGVDLRASLRRSFGDFDDLASHLTADPSGWTDGAPSFAPAQLQQALTLSMPLPSVNGYAGLTYVRSVRAGVSDAILSASYAQTLEPGAATLRIGASKDMHDPRSFGVSVGLTVALGNSTSAAVQLTQTPNGRRTQASLSRQAGHAPGDIGYRLATYGQGDQTSLAFGLTRQGRYNRSELSLRRSGGAVSVNATTSGALVLAGGAVFLANRIVDGFAVADVGVPGITVSMNNRPAAVTGRQGKALVPDLRSYQVNRISIDPLDLPENTSVSATALEAVPARGSGVTLSFGGSTDTSALVVLRDAAGAFLPAGATIALEGSDKTFLMGYDGEVWLEGLKPDNRIVATTPAGPCTASFAFVADPTQQVYIEGLTCQ